MRNFSTKLLKPLLIPLLGWSTLGLQVDLASGPLTPEAALGAICEIVFAHSPAGHDGHASHLPSFVRGRSAPPRRTSNSHPAIPAQTASASWSAPMIVPHPVPAPAPEFGFGGTWVSIELAPAATPTPDAPGGSALGRADLSQQQARLRC